MVAYIQSEIMSKPELFVEPDPELPLALLDQKEVFPHCCYYHFIFYFFYKKGSHFTFCFLLEYLCASGW